MAEKQKASPLILLAIYGTVKFFYEDTTHSPASYAHTTHTSLEMMPSDVVSLGKFLFFVFCLTSKWYSAEIFLSLLASARFLRCHKFPFKTRNFLAASQLFFLVYLTIGLNYAHNFAHFYSKLRSTCRPLLYITCYFKGLANEFQHSLVELKMPCHALFLIPST